MYGNDKVVRDELWKRHSDPDSNICVFLLFVANSKFWLCKVCVCVYVCRPTSSVSLNEITSVPSDKLCSESNWVKDRASSCSLYTCMSKEIQNTSMIANVYLHAVWVNMYMLRILSMTVWTMCPRVFFLLPWVLPEVNCLRQKHQIRSSPHW